jgi:hypothetical protein
MKVTPSGRRYMSSSGHMVLWCVTLMLALMAVVSSFPLVSSLGRLNGFLEEGHPPFRLVTYPALSVMALIALLVWWRRYWFLSTDVQELVSRLGGVNVFRHKSLAGVQLKARFGTLWMLVALNRPLLDVLPTWPTFEFSRKVAMGVVEFMTEGARVGFIQLGDFSRFPEVDIVLVGGRGITPSQTGAEELDRAVGNAATMLGSADDALRIELRKRWLQIELSGGVWLGQLFSEQIERGLKFSCRLVEELAGSFSPLPIEEWTVERKYVRVRTLGRKFVFVREPQLHIVSTQEKT